MIPRTIAVHLDTYETKSDRLAYALAMARRFGAALIARAYALEYDMPAVMLGEMPTAFIEEQRRKAQQAAASAEERLRLRCAGAEVDFELTAATGHILSIAEDFAIYARAADLVIVGQEDPDAGDPVTGRLLETVLFASGRPILVLPHIGAPADAPLGRCLVAWDGSGKAARAAHDAIPLLGQAAEVEILSISRPGAPSDMEQSGRALAAALGRHGISARYHMVPEGGVDPGNALLSYAADRAADLLVMGGYGHSRLREVILGGATRRILASMTLPVLMSH